MKEVVNNHGGARRGPGRPLTGNSPRCPITFSVSTETRDKIRALRGNGCDTNSVLEAVINEQFYRVFGNPK